MFTTPVDGLHMGNASPYVEELLRGLGVSTIEAAFVVDRPVLERIGNGTGAGWFATDAGLVAFSLTVVDAEFMAAEARLHRWGAVGGVEVTARTEYSAGNRAIELTVQLTRPDAALTARSTRADYAQLQDLAQVVRQRLDGHDFGRGHGRGMPTATASR